MLQNKHWITAKKVTALLESTEIKRLLNCNTFSIMFKDSCDYPGKIHHHANKSGFDFVLYFLVSALGPANKMLLCKNQQMTDSPAQNVLFFFTVRRSYNLENIF